MVKKRAMPFEDLLKELESTAKVPIYITYTSIYIFVCLPKRMRAH